MKKIFIPIGVLIAVIAIAVGLTQTPLLAVKKVVVTGNTRLTTAQILDLAAVKSGKTMVSIDTKTVASRVDKSPWVASTEVKRKWPTTIDIAVKERVAAAIAQTSDGRWASVAEDSVVVAVDSKVPSGLPVILDQSVDPTPGARLKATALVTLIGQLPDSLRSKVIQLQRDDKGEVRLGLTTGSIVELGTLDRELGNKLLSAATVISKQDNKNIKVLDVRSPGFPLVTPVIPITTTTTAPAPSSGTTSTTIKQAN